MKKILIGIAMLTLLGTGCQKKVDTEIQDVIPTDGFEWQSPGETGYDYYITKEGYSDPIFSDPESGISFSLTLDADYLRINKSGEGPEKIVSFRIQNYDPKGADKIGLNDIEYYIEFSVYYDDSTGTAYSESFGLEDCATILSSIETVESNEGTRYMGYPDQGGDSGGERYAICYNGNGPDYYLQITDNNSDHPIRELIKSSFFQE